MARSTSNLSIQLAALVLIAAALLMIAVAIALPAYLGGDDEGARARIVTATVSSVGLVAALGAAGAAFLTVFQQRYESRRQRWMETLHQVNEQYEKVFDDVYELKKTGGPVADIDLMRVYNRYFTSLMTAFRYYQMGLIPKSDFLEWTATNIGRFAEGTCLVNWETKVEPNPLRERWAIFDSWGRGPRADFRAYMGQVMQEAERLAAPQARAAWHEALEAAAKRVVASVRFVE